MARNKRVAVLIESSRASGRGQLRGIAEYVRTRNHWGVFFTERGLSDRAPDGLRKWKPDGIIARIESPTLLNQIRHLGLPTVDVLGWLRCPGIPRFFNDRAAIVRMASDHLRHQGLTCFAYCGLPSLASSQIRANLVEAYLGSLGFATHIFPHGGKRLGYRPLVKIEAACLQWQDRLIEWLRSLPKPVGIQTYNDLLAQQVLAACRAGGIRVPDEVAVVGVDNDEILCDLSDPPLSSVALNHPRIGHEAAALLDSMMQRRRPRVEEVCIPPVGVVSRRSSDVLACIDPVTASALRLIREEACNGLSVTDVTHRLHVSPTKLKQRFTAFVGHAPMEEITRVRIDRAKHLLVSTSLPVGAIASQTGFQDSAWFCKQFKKRTRQTPNEYRADLQMPGSSRFAAQRPSID